MARAIKVWNATTSAWEDVAVQQPDTSAFVQNSLWDAKGDLIAATADNTPARLAVGTNGTLLTANSSASTGMEWVTAQSAAGLEAGDTFVGGDGIDRIVALTQAEYDALTPDATTLYIITE